MNNACPKCASPYGVNASHVGRAFKCKNCGSSLIVAEEGLRIREDSGATPAATARPAAPVKAAANSGFAFNEGSAEVAREDDYGEAPTRNGRSSRRGGSSGIGDFLAFRKMVVPIVIQVVFWFFTAIVILGALGFLVMQLMSKDGNLIMGLAAVIFGVPLYIFLIRVYCELLIVIFRINDTLTDIKTELQSRPR